MLPDRVSNPGSLTYESGALPIALRGPAGFVYTGCPHVISPYSLANKGDTAKMMALLWFSMHFCLKEYS